jgi:hypothetical protein
VEVDVGVMASVEDGGIEGSVCPRSYRSGDGTALYGTCLAVTGREVSAGEALLDGGGGGLPGRTSSMSKLSNPAKSSSVSGTSRAQTPNPEPLTVVRTTVPASSGAQSTVRSSKYGRAIHRFNPRLDDCTCLRSYLSPSSGCNNVRRWAADEIRGPNAARRRRSAGVRYCSRWSSRRLCIVDSIVSQNLSLCTEFDDRGKRGALG